MARRSLARHAGASTRSTVLSENSFILRLDIDYGCILLALLAVLVGTPVGAFVAGVIFDINNDCWRRGRGLQFTAAPSAR
jgi:hypothetical protein